MGQLGMRITDLLRTIDVFEQLSSDDLDQLSRRMQDRHLRADEILCRQGAPVESMFIVLSGCIELAAAALEGRPSSSQRLKAGDSFGEVELISGVPHPTTATADGHSRVLEFHKDDFEAIVSQRPQLMRTMLAAISRRAVQANRRLLTEPSSGTGVSSSCRVFTVFSPRGGAGKTTVAIGLATRLAELAPQRVVLLDLDLLFDDATLELSLCAPASLASIADEDLAHFDPSALSSYLVEHPSSLRVLVGATSPEEGERVTAAHVRAALAAIRRQFLVAVVDCGSNFSEPTLAAMEAADRLLVVCTPELVALRDMRDCQRVFGQVLHFDKTKVSYVFNHPLPSAGLTRLQFESALEQPMSLDIPHAGESARRPGFARAIDQLARELRPTEAGPVDAFAPTRTARATRKPSRGLPRLWRRDHER
jgi:CRP-like cAMP-binding protein